MEATNNGQTFQYSLPSKPTPSGGYTWAGFKTANPHLEVAGLGAKGPSNDWIKATATATGLVPCRGVAQFNAFGAQKIAERCLPMVKEERQDTHGTNGWASLNWVKDEFHTVKQWFNGRCDSQSQEIASLHQAIASKMDHDAMIRAFDRLISEVDALGAQVTQLSAQLAARDAHPDVAMTPTPQPAAARRRTWRDFFGF